MTRAELTTRASWILGAGADPIHGSREQTLIHDLLYDAIVDMLSRTRINVRCVDLELEAGVDEYTLPTTGGMLKLHNLRNSNEDELLEVGPGDIRRSDFGSYAYSIPGYNRIALSWDPATGEILSAYYTPRPTKMAADGDSPSTDAFGAIPMEYHPALVNYVAWKGADIFGDAGSGRGEKYRILYEGKDGTGEIGSDLGRIKTGTNLRIASGSSARRTARARVGIGHDGIPAGRDDFWRG